MNTQQKVIVVGVIILVALLLFLAWYYDYLTLPTTYSIPITQPSYIQEPEDDSEIIIDTPSSASFQPLKSDSDYAVVTLTGDVTKYATSGVPMPNMSLYNVNTQSYLTGLGDPIRGDLVIEPRNANNIKSTHSSKDARVGALTSLK